MISDQSCLESNSFVMLSPRKRMILSRFAVRLENCFSQTSLKRANTFRLIDS